MNCNWQMSKDILEVMSMYLSLDARSQYFCKKNIENYYKISQSRTQATSGRVIPFKVQGLGSH